MDSVDTEAAGTARDAMSVEPARWVTFDCYGTLVDWRHGIRTACDLIAPGHGEELSREFARHEPAVQGENPRMRYRLVLAEALRRATIRLGLPLNEDDALVLGETIGFWPVFPEVHGALTGLRAAGWNLALLTNCDRDLIALTQRRFQVPLDAVITAEDVGAYKPSHEHFHRFQRAHRVAADRWVHVAQSWFHDILPAQDLGIRRIWIDRLHEAGTGGRDPAVADAVLHDLTGIVAAVQTAASRAGTSQQG